MLLNGKPFERWDKEDLQIMLCNPDFRENEFIDYKQTFSFLCIEDQTTIQKKKTEFRHDICSFANAEGGYIFYGIKEDKGIPIELCGVTIADEDTDKFELSRRNDIINILPMPPALIFRFIQIAQELYVIALQIEKGILTPYVSRENEETYRFLIRRGNGKKSMNYNEIQSMFGRSYALSKEIKNFRLLRIEELYDQTTQSNNRLAIIHIIPNTFLDASTFVNPYNLLRTKAVYYPTLFEPHCSGISMPNVDGLSYPDEYKNGQTFQIYNNNIIEKTIKLRSTIDEGKQERLQIHNFIAMIPALLKSTANYYRTLKTIGRAYIGITVLGCKGICSEYDFYSDYNGIVDRNQILCQAVAIDDINIDACIEEASKNQITLLCLALE